MGHSVAVIDRDRANVNSSMFDFVLVCSGHYDQPFIPPVPNIDTYTGLSLHSKEYDSPELYRDKRVLVVGGCFQVAQYVTSLALCHFLPHSRSVQFVNGESVEVDSVIWATGYKYHYPYLSSLCVVDRCSDTSSGSGGDRYENHGYRHKRWRDTRLTSAGADGGDKIVPELYEQLVYIPHPSLAFLGLPFSIIPFPLIYVQALVLCHWFSNMNAHMPSTEDMYESLMRHEKNLLEQYGEEKCDRFYHFLEVTCSS
ncbi:unnamed protein product, partial [Sphagnum compactum]